MKPILKEIVLKMDLTVHLLMVLMICDHQCMIIGSNKAKRILLPLYPLVQVSNKSKKSLIWLKKLLMKIQSGRKQIMFWEIIKRNCARDHRACVVRAMLAPNITTPRIKEEIQRSLSIGTNFVMIFSGVYRSWCSSNITTYCTILLTCCESIMLDFFGNFSFY